MSYRSYRSHLPLRTTVSASSMVRYDPHTTLVTTPCCGADLSLQLLDREREVKRLHDEVALLRSELAAVRSELLASQRTASCLAESERKMRLGLSDLQSSWTCTCSTPLLDSGCVACRTASLARSGRSLTWASTSKLHR